MNETVMVEVFSDIACPWCYIGEHRLTLAMEQNPEIEVEWNWRPYQLQPRLPAEGVEWGPFARSKFAGDAGAAAAFRTVTQAGQGDGIEFRFDRITRAPNTARAHQMVLFASKHGAGRATARALFRAYFGEGRDITSIETLVEIGASEGLDRSPLEAYLHSGAGLKEVVESQEEAMQLGVAGVPFYIFNRRFAISGAQPAELFATALRQAADSR